MRKIILASQSPQRKALMVALGLPFEVIPSDIDEKLIVEDDQKLRAQIIAKAKADEVAKNNPEAIIIAADTFTFVNGKSHEKPETKDEAIKMLKEQSGQKGLCYSGFAYIDKEKNIEIYDTVVSEIVFRKLFNFEIEKYVKENPVTTWSAAFSPAYSAGVNFVESINGSLSNITHGLPMEMLLPLLEKSGALNEEE